MRRAAPLLVLCLLASACALTQPINTPTPSAETESASPSVPVETAVPSPSPTPEPTPGPDAVPIFSAGSRVATNAPGLRVRSRPGTEQRVITSLGVDADLLVGLGPIVVDGLGWYLVRDADDSDPEFGEGWVAAGFEPDPFLIPASFEVAFEPFVAGFAHDAGGEFGPVLLPDAPISMRWIAAPLDEDGCSFSVDLRPAGEDAVTTVRGATVGGVPASGEVFTQFFDAHPELFRGDLFVVATTDCSWALSFVRGDSPASPTPGASD